MLNGRIVLHALRDSSSWGVKKPIKYHGTENNIVGMVEVSNGWVGMTCVCKPCCLFVVYLLIQGLSLVFFATFIPFNLQAVNTFIMKGVNKTKQQQQKEFTQNLCEASEIWLLDYSSPSYPHHKGTICYYQRTWEREEKNKNTKKRKRQHRKELGKWTKAEKTCCCCWRGKRGDMVMTEKLNSIQQRTTLWRNIFMLSLASLLPLLW